MIAEFPIQITVGSGWYTYTVQHIIDRPDLQRFRVLLNKEKYIELQKIAPKKWQIFTSNYVFKNPEAGSVAVNNMFKALDKYLLAKSKKA